MNLRMTIAVVLASLSAMPAVGAESPLFPFVIDYGDPANVTNMSGWLQGPAGKHGHVRVEQGRLVTDAGPIRFWATNLCFNACFPSHEQAERLAARLARLGINGVRLHHMDMYSIWGSSPDKLTIDPARLERLDYLIHQLKQHGIYVDINLHVSRTFGAKEGFMAEDRRPLFDKGLDNFEPRMIELQKKYARDLLTHVNPYTQTRYTQEPAVAFVEISNEDALFAVWHWGQIDDLPDPYATTLRQRWNGWLRKKYGTTEALRQAWKAGEYPEGEQMLRNGDFSQADPAPWLLETDEATRCQWSIQPGGPQGSRLLRLVVERTGSVSWHPQFYQTGLALAKDKPYTVRFLARADRPHHVTANCHMAHEPWRCLGLAVSMELGTDWKPYQYTFEADRDEPNARLGFTDLEPGTYEFAAVSLRPGGLVGIQPNKSLEENSVPVLSRRSLNLTRSARQDFVDFIWDTERDYWWGMKRFLKEELGLRSLVCGTQLAYGPMYVQAGLDYLDDHSYWEHPQFPHRSWDSKDWFVRNVALVNQSGGTLATLASRRVDSMVYTVSEYNHPAPNAYAAEAFPMIAAFAAFQGWNGVYSFAYSHNEDFEPRRIIGFFDIKSETGKIAHQPACAAMLLRGDVAPARQRIVVNVSQKDERLKLGETLNPWALSSAQFGMDPRYSLLHGIALRLTENKGAKPAELPGDQNRFISDTGELCWDISQQRAGYFTVDTQRTKLFTGFVRGRTFRLGNVTLEIGPTRLDWATVSMTCMDGAGFDQPGRILLALTGWVQNQDMTLEALGEDRVTLRDRWGSEPVLCEGVPAEITLPAAPERVRLYELDESGNRRNPIPCQTRESKALLVVGPQHKTVWYEIHIQ